MKKNKIKMIEVTIPSWALCAIVNGDDSGLSDEEIEQLDRFVESNKIQSVSLKNDNDEGYFSRYNDINNLGDTVFDCVAIVR